MTERELETLKYFSEEWNRLQILNQPYKDVHNQYLAIYRGWREKGRYPMAYDISFRKVLPILFTILSRFMSQLHQTPELVSCFPVRAENADRAEVIEGLMNWQLDNMNSCDRMGGMYNVNMQWFLSAFIYGTGITHAYWKKEERLSPMRVMTKVPVFDSSGFAVDVEEQEQIIEQVQPVYDAPYVENVNLMQFFPNPEYDSIQLMPSCAYVYKKSLDWIYQHSERNGGPFKNVMEIGHLSKTKKVDEMNMIARAIEGGYTLEQIQTDRKTNDNIDIVDIYARYVIEDAPYELGSGYKMKGKEEECIITIANGDTLIRDTRNKYGKKPFFRVGCYPNLDRFYDIGLIEATKGILTAYDELGNLRMQDASMKVNTMLKVLVDSEIEPESLIWKPFGLIPVDTQEDVEPLIIPDFNRSVFEEQIKFFDESIHDILGVYPYSMGQEPARQERVGTIQSIQSMGEARIKLLLLTMDHVGLRPLFKYMMLLNTFHLPSGFEFRVNQKSGYEFMRAFGNDIHPEWDFVSRYTSLEPSLSKGAKLEKLITLSQMWRDNPYIRSHQFVKAIVELSDLIPAERYLKSEEEVQKEKQMHQQIQMAMMQQERQFELQKTQIGQAGAIAASKEKSQTALQTTAMKEQGRLLDTAIKTGGKIKGDVMKTQGKLIGDLAKITTEAKKDAQDKD